MDLPLLQEGEQLSLNHTAYGGSHTQRRIAGRSHIAHCLEMAFTSSTNCSAEKKKRRKRMGGFLNVSGLIGGIITLIVGIVILVWPRIIAYVIGIWLIIVGIIAIVNSL